VLTGTGVTTVHRYHVSMPYNYKRGYSCIPFRWYTGEAAIADTKLLLIDATSRQTH